MSSASIKIKDKNKDKEYYYCNISFEKEFLMNSLKNKFFINNILLNCYKIIIVHVIILIIS